jgi:hypothetical protein
MSEMTLGAHLLSTKLCRVDAIGAAVPNTLDLDPELGDAHFIQELEKVFALRLSQSDVGDWLTIGDVYDTLRTYVDDGLWRDGACMDAMVFRHLRHPLAKFVPNRKLSPTTPMSMFEKTSVKRLLAHLSSETGLNVPHCHLSCTPWVFLPLVLIGTVGWLPIIALASSWWFIPAFSLLCLFVVARLDPGALPADCHTLGEFAHRVSALNYGKLREGGARSRPGDVWRALLNLAAEQSSLPSQEIGRETYLLR